MPPDDHPGGLSLSHTDHGTYRVVHLSGQLDLAASGAQARQLLALPVTAPGPLTVLEMTGVDFCDSTGIGLLAGIARSAAEHGVSVRLAGLQDHIRRLFTLTGVHRLLPDYPDLAHALAGDPGRREPAT